MIKRNGYFLAAILFGFSFMTACSKNLMPPEGMEGMEGMASVGSQMSLKGPLEDSGDSAGSSARSGFNIQEQGNGSGSGFLTEENVGESARSGRFSSDGSDGFAQGDGSAQGGGRFQSDAEPFLGDSGGRDEARMLPFKDTSSLQDIHFRFDRSDLDDQSRGILRQNASYLKANSSAIIEIQGHCDERGTNNYNIALGERRAHSTKMYLVSQGVSARRVHTISYGEERPFCFDSNDTCWLKNRRAHFRISK